MYFTFDPGLTVNVNFIFTLREPNVYKPHGFFLGFLATLICFCVTVLFYRYSYFVVNQIKLQKLQSFYIGSFIGPYPVIVIANETISWVCHAGLLGITKDHKLTWTKHLTELKKNFVNNLNLLRKCSFLRRKFLLDLYFKTILPSVTYGITLGKLQ